MVYQQELTPYDVISNDLKWVGKIFDDVENRAACLRQLGFLLINLQRLIHKTDD